MYYSLHARFLEPGQVIMRRHQKIESFFIVEHGELEAFIDLDGNKFILERFPKGTVVNSRSMITEDESIMQIRANQATKILEFSKDLLADVQSQYK